MKIDKVRLFVILIAVFLIIAYLLSSCAILDPGSDPVRVAEANSIIINANNQADMNTARQAVVLQSQYAMAQAQAQALVIDAQTRAQTATLWATIYAASFILTITLFVIFLMFRTKVKSDALMISNVRVTELPKRTRSRYLSAPPDSGYSIEKIQGEIVDENYFYNR